jgi:hypothetical protein
VGNFEKIKGDCATYNIFSIVVLEILKSAVSYMETKTAVFKNWKIGS